MRWVMQLGALNRTLDSVKDADGYNWLDLSGWTQVDKSSDSSYVKGGSPITSTGNI